MLGVLCGSPHQVGVVGCVISEPLPFRIPLLVQGHMPHDNWRCAGRPGPALALRGQHLSPQGWRWTQVGGMCFLWPPQPGMGTRGHGWRMHSEVTWGLPQGPRQLTVAPDTKDVLRHGDGLGGHPWSRVGCAVHRLQADLCGLWGWQ